MNSRKISQIISGILHPMFMPTYGILLVFGSFLIHTIAPEIRLAVFLSIFISTSLMVMLAHLIMLKMGLISDLDVSQRKDRTLPYIVCIGVYGLGIFSLLSLGAPVWILGFMLGAAVMLFFLMLISMKWKISAHLSGIGGLTGGVFALSYLFFINPYWLFIALFVAAGILAAARMQLKAHTLAQTLAGFWLGFFCIFSFILLFN